MSYHKSDFCLSLFSLNRASDIVVNRPPTLAPTPRPSQNPTTGSRRSTTPDPADITTTSVASATDPMGDTGTPATSSARPTTTANPANDADPCAFVDELVPDVAREFVCEHVPDDLCRFSAGRCVRTPCLLANHLPNQFKRQACEAVQAGQCAYHAL